MMHYETQHINLLLIENDPEIKAKFIDYIENTKLNITVTVVNNGNDGIAAFTENNYDCVLLNYVLPDMNAQILLSNIQDGPILSVPIIVYSQQSIPSMGLEVLESGAIDFITYDKCNSRILQSIILHALVRGQYIRSQQYYFENMHQLLSNAHLKEEKLINKLLEHDKKNAENSNVAKSEFLAQVSHELRNPLNAILGFAQVIELEDSENKVHQESLYEIKQAGKHLLMVINGLLNLAKIESDKEQLLMDKVDLGEIIEESIALLQPIATNYDVTVSKDYALELFVLADRLKLKQAIINLISNALKYNVSGGHVNVATMKNNSTAKLVVSDTGLGIPKDKLSDIFLPFNRSVAEKSTIEGTGIGLTITKKIVEQMGGEIGVESCVNEGSKFWFQVPLIQP